jgi:phage-related minor tail protein
MQGIERKVLALEKQVKSMVKSMVGILHEQNKAFNAWSKSFNKFSKDWNDAQEEYWEDIKEQLAGKQVETKLAFNQEQVEMLEKAGFYVSSVSSEKDSFFGTTMFVMQRTLPLKRRKKK